MQRLAPIIKVITITNIFRFYQHTEEFFEFYLAPSNTISRGPAATAPNILLLWPLICMGMGPSGAEKELIWQKKQRDKRGGIKFELEIRREMPRKQKQRTGL